MGFQATDVVEVHASYGEAFRQPSVGELFFPFSGNPDLDPERSQSAELGLGLRPGKHRIDAAVFTTDSEDLIDFNFATFSFANVEQVEINGFELSWSAPVSKAVDSTLQATWLDTEDQDGLELLRRPEWSSSLSFNGRIGERVRGDLSVLYVGERADIDPVTFARTRIGSYVSAHLGVSYELIAGLEVTARVQNLADEDYEEVAGYPASGRALHRRLALVALVHTKRRAEQVDVGDHRLSPALRPGRGRPDVLGGRAGARGRADR